MGCGVGCSSASFAGGGFCFFAAFSGAVGVLQREFVVPLVGRVHHLVEVFVGELLLCKVVYVRSCMAKVVRGPVGCVDHVCLFEEVVGGGV